VLLGLLGLIGVGLRLGGVPSLRPAGEGSVQVGLARGRPAQAGPQELQPTPADRDVGEHRWVELVGAVVVADDMGGVVAQRLEVAPDEGDILGRGLGRDAGQKVGHGASSA
jgi:hypothetical protein